jgi:hypothetical protein
VSAKWADGLARWQPHYGEDGQVYSLTHLHPHRFTLKFAAWAGYPARDVEIRVGYSSHPFTTRCPDGTAPHAPYSKPHDPRVFCRERYRLSHQLPKIIESIETRRCYATSFRNYFILDTLDVLPANTEYRVFFNTKQTAPDSMRLFVESAYAANPSKLPHGVQRESLMFRALVSKTLGLKKANPA